ncbi:RDD family protein [Natronolimnobius baerhuensis]|uniref:RDD family protein n=1 Tax=Natronolimnobius baerhuensis TaxID=253108 RepID=A0A202ECL2_9EURY|nr:RDD family protein [Natronolimnobius baerhuensis]OVE85959.1 RDD family protein [Natronolimnobius baerhuensis]
MAYYADQPAHAGKRQAGLLARALAWIVDGVVSVIALVAILVPLLALFAPSGMTLEDAEGIGSLVGLGFLFVYYIGTEAAWSQTPGKMVLGIRVVQTDGRECSTGGAIARNITKILGGAALFPVLVAVLLILSTDDNQRLGDIFGETTVVNV